MRNRQHRYDPSVDFTDADHRPLQNTLGVVDLGVPKDPLTDTWHSPVQSVAVPFRLFGRDPHARSTSRLYHFDGAVLLDFSDFAQSGESN